MFEKRKDPLVSTSIFLLRLAISISFGLFLIAAALFMGMAGYHYYEKMPWVDAFNNAAMILSGMGPVAPLATYGGKVFAGCYALFSGLFFILIMAIIFAPIVHRFFHKFHLEMIDDEGDKNDS